MSKALFVADSHANHGNIILYCDRPFIKVGDTFFDKEGKERWVSKYVSQQRAKEMTECLIKDWNSVVDPNDIVYHLGDFSFGDPTEFIYRLNGKIVLLPGNHDKDILDFCYHNTAPSKIRVMGGLPTYGDKVYTAGMINIMGQEMFMSHFKHAVWDKSHRGVWHLYGHSHDTFPDSNNEKSMDVGVDSHYRLYGNFAPFTFEEIKAQMDKKIFTPVDHHGN